MNPTRILVAINSPHGREAAFEYALKLARRSGAELYLLHAVPAKQRFSFRAVERLERMTDMRQRAEEVGVRVQTVEQHGDPAEIIELHAHTREVDLIVMGAEPRRSWGRRRSAVAETVIRRTHVPTLVIASDAFESPTPFTSVLAAVDLSPASEDVLRAAIGLASDEAARLTVMHTVTGIESADAVQSPARWMVPEYRAHVTEDVRRHLEAVVSAVHPRGEVRVRVTTGSAARAILEEAAGEDADLVVVGRSRGVKLLGSTALRILRKNDRALLVIPGKGDRAGSVEQLRAA
jgi:nucleotide-binding universal stress UspA family protein